MENRDLPPEAKRALEEAKLRRKQAELNPSETPKEVAGRKGPDPVRFGDWEKNGIAIDF